jgi:hypothetical protein
VIEGIVVAATLCLISWTAYWIVKIIQAIRSDKRRTP